MSKTVYSVISGKLEHGDNGPEENIKYARDFDKFEDAKKEYDFNSDYPVNRIEIYVDGKKVGTMIPE